MTWFADMADHVTPDTFRAGDFYDVLSGRFALQTWAQMNPFVELADSVGVRRARQKDRTSSGLGFEMMIAHQGEMSNAIVHLPAADHPVWESGRLPIVVDAHGFSDSPRAHSERAGIAEAAVSSGAIAIALGGSRSMEGSPMPVLVRSHDGMDANGGRPLKATDGPALIEFILDNVEAPLREYAQRKGLGPITIDRDDVLIDGFSNGGALTALAVAAGKASNGISFSGPTSAQIRDLVPPGPVNMIFVGGVDDAIVPVDGPQGQFSADFVPPAEAAQIFADHNGTGPLSDTDLPPFLAKLVQPGVTVHASGDRKRGLTAYIEIEGNGHAVPGAKPTVSGTLDGPMRLHASDKISGAELVRDLLDFVR